MTEHAACVTLVKGQPDPDLVTVYAVVRNEMFFLPAFLEHYRKMGVRQFLFLDDQSDDGSFDFLAAQPDCILARSPLRYGERVNGQRAAHLWKNEIPRIFLQDRWAICADADEFLFIPPQFRDIAHFTRTLDDWKVSAVAAAMVDFYPATIAEMENAGVPSGAAELFRAYPWFDRGPYFRWSAVFNRQIVLHGGVRERLLQKFSISKRGMSKTGLALAAHKMKQMLMGSRNINSIGKVPLVKWTKGRQYLHSHKLNESPDRDIVLPLAHFKFTSFLYRKIESAIASRAHAGGSRAYVAYAELMSAMKSGDGSFIYPGSVEFHDVGDFSAAGLLTLGRYSGRPG